MMADVLDDAVARSSAHGAIRSLVGRISKRARRVLDEGAEVDISLGAGTGVAVAD